MITDDPGTPGPGNWEINIAATRRHVGASREGESPLFDLNFGVGERVQLKYEVAWATRREEGETVSGLGSSLLGVKWRFVDAAEEGWNISTYPQVEVRNPGSRSAERGLADDGTGVLLPLQLQRTYGLMSWNFEIGRELRSRGSGEWFGGIAAGREVGETIELLGELHSERPIAEGRFELALNVGARMAVGRLGTLLVSIGRELRAGSDDPSAIFGYLGWQVATGSESRR
jgi:hypothetical protein